jgi:hypothetical protein
MRDQLLRRLEALGLSGDSGWGGVRAGLEALPAELAAQRAREHEALTERIAAFVRGYGDQRETDAYLDGVQAAARPGGDTRPLRSVPPPRTED